MSIENIKKFIKAKAAEFGAKTDDEANGSYVWRDNTGSDALKDSGAFFGFIHPEEDRSGPYHDFSLVIFPSDEKNDESGDGKNKAWLISLCVGSNGFKNDYELAISPGLRRLFSKLVEEKGFCKTDFSDIETNLPRSITGHDDLQHIKNTIKTYTKVLPVCRMVDDPAGDEGKKVIAAFVAGYAKIRDWPSNNSQRKAVSEALAPYLEIDKKDDVEEIKNLLTERRFIVLQGPPGTGKTRAAKEVAKNTGSKTFFTQFHAETSYSDFIYGIRPDTDNDELRYKEKPGVFAEAIEYADKHKDENVILIIDEINRANLSNVLGPVFYLFEHKMEDSDVSIEIAPALKITMLPKNFFVIATMNTADRSLAVVDFALRRRFAWYNKQPNLIDGTRAKVGEYSVNKIVGNKGKTEYFFKEDFAKFSEFFDWHASSNELNLQPGEGYFIAASELEMENRIRYELFPLIKEYLQEGLLQSAKEEFNDYFLTRIKQTLYE